MASAACQTVSGVYSAAQPFKVRAYTCRTIAGAEMAAGNVAWGGSVSKRSRVNWMPGAQVPVLDAAGRMAPVWYKFFQEIAENRLGGIDAPTVPQVVTNQNETQVQVLAVQTLSTQTSANLSQVADTVNVVRDVAVQNNLSGSAQIARLPSYKQAQLKGGLVP